MKNDQVSGSEPMEVVRICPSAEAKMIEEVLRKNGISSSLQGDVIGVLPAGDLDDVRVWVQRNDAENAHQLIDAFFTTMTREEVPDEGSESETRN